MKMDGVTSTPLRVIPDVAHGPTIGPFLFIMYINDLIAYIRCRELQLTLYAEETILYCSGNTVNSLF